MSRQTRYPNDGREQPRRSGGVVRGRSAGDRKHRPLLFELLEDRVVPGTLTYSKTVFFGNPTSTAAVSGDVTGDGVRDTVVADGATFRVYSGVAPKPQLTSFIVFPPPASGTLKFAVGDITGDGKADLQVWGKLSGVSPEQYRFYDAAALAGVPQLPPIVPPPAALPSGTLGTSGPVTEGGTATVGFTQVSDPLGQAVTYSFDFGNDGTFEVTGSTAATIAVPTALTADGPQSVAVRGRVTAADGRSADYTTQLQVTNAAPVAVVGSAGYAGVQGAPVAFQGSATDPSPADAAAGFAYAWNFGDGTTGTGPSPTHTYTSAGTFTVTLTVTDKDGAAGTATGATTVSAAISPTGVLATSGPVVEGGTASVGFTQVSDPLGQAVTYSFDFGDDGTFEVAGGSSASAAVPAGLTADGSRTVPVRGRLTAADGRFTDYTTQLQVTNAAPTATATAPTVVPLGSQAAFQGSATDPSAADAAAGLSYAWNFGDGATGSGSAPTHTYAAAGTYTVTLSVTDKDGGTGTATRAVTAYSQSQTDSGVVVTPDWIITKYEKIPNFGGHPTLVAAQSGAWSDPATWGGRVPAVGEIVSIGAGVAVTYDQVSDAKLDTVSVEAGGTLQFRTDASTRLRVTNLLVLEGGTLTIGTTAAPVLAGVKAEIIFNDLPLDTTKDPEQYGHGLIAFGTVTMHGAVLSDTFMELAAEPHAGDTTLTLKAPVTGWKSGDKVALPDTRQLYSEIRPDVAGSSYIPQWESLAVASVSADGLTITLTAPLAYDHLGAHNPDGNVDMMLHVANLTRNVLIKSESSLGSRGHTLFTARADVDIRYAQFAGLGRTTIDQRDDTKFDDAGNLTHVGTNQFNRYPVNFYHLRGPAASANGAQFTFEGNTVVCLMNQFRFRWGIALNDSHYGHVDKNVVYNWAGAGILAGQTGNETGNVIAGNYVSRIQGTGGRSDDRGSGELGFEGSGIWSRSVDNYFRDNVTSDTRHGYTLWPYALSEVHRPLFPGADTLDGSQYQSLDPRNLPLREFARNQSYGGATELGLEIWSLGTANYSPFADARESVIKDFRVWHVWSKGYYNYMTNRVTFDGLVARGDMSIITHGRSGSVMFFAGDYASYNFKVVNSNVQGFLNGYSLQSMGDQSIVNTYMRNYVDFVISPMWWLNTATALPARQVTITNVQFVPLGVPDYWEYGPQKDIVMNGAFRGDSTTLITPDDVYVYQYNGDPTKNYRIYYNEQAASYVLPQSVVAADGNVRLNAAPVAGLTNAEAWTLYGIAFAGSVAPLTAMTLSNVTGLVCVI